MDFLKGFLNGARDLPFWVLAIRAIFLYIALIVATRMMGHRQVGILTGHNYLVAAGIVSLAAIRINKYHHPVLLLETFVDCERFRGTCHQAANWIYVGKTQGRSRNDRYNTLCVPVKDCYLYPLIRGFREVLQ